MFSFVKKGLYCALLVGGLSVIGAGVANAAESPDTSGASGILSGTQAIVDAAAPVTVTGNAISVIGDSNSADTTTATTPASTNIATPEGATTNGSDSTLGGTQAVVDAAAPVTVTGNAISVIGDSNSADTTTATTAADTSTNIATPEGATTNGSDSTLGGTQAIVDAAAPVTVTGNAISVIGDSNSTDTTTTTTAADTSTATPDGTSTNGGDSALGGTQAIVDAAARAAVTGNAISVIGDSNTADTTTAPAAADTATPDGATTNGSDSILGGTQAVVDAAAPAAVTGNAISVIGDSGATGNTSTVPETPVNPVGPTAPVTPVTPVNPITRVTPVTPVTPITSDGTVSPASDGTVSPAQTGSNSAAASTRTASSTVAGFVPTALATTGANPALLLGIALVPVVVGTLLLILLAGLRRRQSLKAWPVSES